VRKGAACHWRAREEKRREVLGRAAAGEEAPGTGWTVRGEQYGVNCSGRAVLGDKCGVCRAEQTIWVRRGESYVWVTEKKERRGVRGRTARGLAPGGVREVAWCIMILAG
jgi:hypothetical protein